MLRSKERKTKLTSEEISRFSGLVFEYINSHRSIRNRELRAISQISYDQAVHFFGEMVRRGVLKRIGTGSGTHYVFK